MLTLEQILKRGAGALLALGVEQAAEAATEIAGDAALAGPGG
jgi:hypothetical protein